VLVTNMLSAQEVLDRSSQPAVNESTRLFSGVDGGVAGSGAGAAGGDRSAGAKPVDAYRTEVPRSFEDAFRRADDSIIWACQLLHGSDRAAGKPLEWLCLAFTGATTIEIGVAAPVFLFVLGYDALASWAAYVVFAAAFVSQFPKRFLWRTRPFACRPPRAKKSRRNETSSFPSRAVTCAVIYGLLAAHVAVFGPRASPAASLPGAWYALVLGITLLVSFARVHLGVHFPSDCLFGAAQGALVAAVGTAAAAAVQRGCSSCLGGAGAAAGLPYTPVSDARHCITAGNAVSALNAGALGVGSLCAFAALALATSKPLQFWTKASHIFGFLLPTIVFELTFLCPCLTGAHSA
jgi:membrane-associated phospholipid phosphatase